MKNTLFLLVFLITVHSIQVQADPRVAYIQGVPISCTAENGQDVKFYDHPGAAVIAETAGGARADFTSTYGYTIALDTLYLNNYVSLFGGLFTVYHACGYLALPKTGFFSSREKEADCFAFNATKALMKELDLYVSEEALQEAMLTVLENEGAHKINQRRIYALDLCD